MTSKLSEQQNDAITYFSSQPYFSALGTALPKSFTITPFFSSMFVKFKRNL